jgi:hypothetical protein
LANGREQGVIKELWNFISFMISPKGLHPCNEVVEQTAAEAEFIPIKKKKGIKKFPFFLFC